MHVSNQGGVAAHVSAEAVTKMEDTSFFYGDANAPDDSSMKPGHVFHGIQI